jgi:hypothetical protein
MNLDGSWASGAVGQKFESSVARQESVEESVDAPFGRDDGMTTGPSGFFEDFTRLADHLRR